MTQKQVEESSCVRVSEDFDTVQWESNQVICQLDERFSLVVKRYNREVYILLRSGTKCFKLPTHIFEKMCNAQITVTYLKQCLENRDADCPWLCCYCGERFVSEKKCMQHEQEEHVPSNNICFHANIMECEQCTECSEGFRMSGM